MEKPAEQQLIEALSGNEKCAELVSPQQRIFRFPVAVLAFFAFCALTFFLPPRSGTDRYFSAIAAKHQRLGDLHSPKIIFIGGSNLAFGLDSASIEGTFKRPVINMGLCAPFGLRFILDEVKDQMKTGDTVVLVPEYSLLEMSDGSSDLFRAVEAYPASALWIYRAYSAPDALGILTKMLESYLAAKWTGFFTLVQDVVLRKASFSVLTRPVDPKASYEEHGDFIGHLGAPSVPRLYLSVVTGNRMGNSESLINLFAEQARARGARLVVIPPPISQQSYALSPARIEELFSSLCLTGGITVLSKPSRYVFPDSDFYETPYQLNAHGRFVRTQRIAEDLSHIISVPE